MDEFKNIGDNHPDDVKWLCSLSESELDLLISLKKLALRRAQIVGHESLAQKFDLKMLRALGFILMQLTKGELNDLQLSGLTGLDDLFDGCNLLKLGLEDRIKTEEQAKTEAQAQTGEQAKTKEQTKLSLNVGRTGRSGRRKLKRWTKPEEECLINGLLEMTLDPSWKADGSFKVGYKNKLEERMNENFPGCGWKANPHIESKIRLLKDKYYMLTEMLRTSGFSWDKEKNMIVCERQSYEEICKQHNNAPGLWNVPFPVYEKLAIIFGGDQATGVQSKTFFEAVDNQEETLKLDKGDGDKDDEIEDNLSVNQAKQSAPSEPSSKKTKKGKHLKGTRENTSSKVSFVMNV